MKKIKYLFILLFLGSLGCQEFLDKEPLDIISDAVVWDDEGLIDSYLADLYYRTDFIEIRGNYAEQTSFAMVASMGGEGRSFGAHHQSYVASTNVITSSGVPSELDYWNYKNIRDCNYFIEKIQGSSLDPALVNQRIAEVRFLRAYMYFQMVIRFGGVPILTEAQSMDATPEEIYVPRDSEKAVYDFIINEMTELAQVLPSTYEAKDKGRPTQWAAYALQSRAALYAASIAKYGQVQLGGLLGFPASDVEKYAKISYDASKAILNNGIHALYEKHADPTVNFQNLFLDEADDNKEVIMAEVYDYSKNRAHAFTLRSMTHDANGTWASMLYLYDFIERFEFADGTPGTSISRTDLTTKEWSSAELFGSRDARLKASVFYPECPWQGGKAYFHTRTIRDGKTYTAGTSEDGWPYASITRNNNRTGLMVRKRCNESMKTEPVINDETDYIIFRIGEIYLNLAEAAFYRGYTQEALDALNRLRQRAAMPPKTEITEAIIQNERLVELTWENHSYWDIRRWRIAKSVLDGVRMKGLQYTYNYNTKKYKIVLTNAEGVARTFQDRNYYLPLGVNRVAENPNFVENPDY
ncbi:MAG: RagB/SusD family nutrient uptake outer membrane protein [Prolixibacteraceae bacterium]|nr:RagB/SusD family nutrient uptake outer membrane protein [Prolixibacteraceae bacterium]